MIRVERDPDWWADVASHPAVQGTLFGSADAVGAVALNPAVLPLAADNGGFFFARMDVAGFALELHTLFRPKGWGREVHGAAKEAFEYVFARGCQVVVTYQVEGNERSQPPRSFRFVQAGEYRHAGDAAARFRAWVLTKSAWEDSPAHRRMTACPSYPSSLQ